MKIVIISGIILTLIAAAILIYLFKTDAPLTEGKVKLRQEYKENLTLDIYLPTTRIGELSPTILFIHGGAWIGGTERSINFNRFNDAVHNLRAAGFTVVSPQYTLATKERPPFPYCVEDIFAAANWLVLHADEYKLDLERFGVFGESAGAHLAMMLAYAEPTSFNLDLEIPEVKYVVDVYGPTELYSLYHSTTVDSLNHILERLPERLRHRLDLSQRLFGFDPEEDEARTKAFATRFSPLAYVNEKVPPTLIVHGTKDQVVPTNQSEQLQKQLDSLDVDHEFHTLEGVNHGFIGATKEQKEIMQRWISEFILDKTNPY